MSRQNQAPSKSANPEQRRLSEARDGIPWRRWGPYLAERAWGTVREDYSLDGNAWDYFPHDMARSRAYRWSEDGLAGICDDQQVLCFAIALWNGRDPILKERLFGLSNHEGNHGEDVKECYFYLDNTPTHSYMKMLYRYPHAAFPYRQLVEINQHRNAGQPEYELADCGVFAGDAFFDVQVEYAKADPETILIRITVTNRSADEAAMLHLLPTLWFRNTWAWSMPPGPEPHIKVQDAHHLTQLIAEHPAVGTRRLYLAQPVETLFTFNETNNQRLFGVPNAKPAVKDAFHEYLINKQPNAVHAQLFGTKAAYNLKLPLEAGQSKTVELVFTGRDSTNPFQDFSATFAQRLSESEEFYRSISSPAASTQQAQIQRQALGGLLWSKQFYNYNVKQWLPGDGAVPAPRSRLNGRNSDWKGLNSHDIILMPDKWEYPWFAAWDWCFHCLTIAYVDIDFAKSQMELFCGERLQHLSGQLPAYEWNFSDVNPPLQALAAWRIYNMGKRQNNGAGDRAFLERIFHKLLINFVWWVNKKDAAGNNVFEGGFLGLDNISVFDRSKPLPNGEFLEQADATGWMGLFCLNMLTIALELAQEDAVYEHLAIEFLEHFMAISAAINASNDQPTSLWNENDGFYYDTIRTPNGDSISLTVRSQVGLIPLYAVQVLEKSWFDKLPAFKQRYDDYLNGRRGSVSDGMGTIWKADGSACLLAIPSRNRVQRVMQRVMDEAEFLSPFGLRSLSKYHLDHPYHFGIQQDQWVVRYMPAESNTSAFGGNSNWRGPIWFPTAYLLITALRTFHRFYGDDLKVDFPAGSGKSINLLQASDEISRRMTAIFLPDKNGHRPVFGGQSLYRDNPLWKDLLLFHEYFNGDDGAGLGASHQTGWTALVVQMIDYMTRGYAKTGG